MKIKTDNGISENLREITSETVKAVGNLGKAVFNSLKFVFNSFKAGVNAVGESPTNKKTSK